MKEMQKTIVNYGLLIAIINILGFSISTVLETESTPQSVLSLLLNAANILVLYYAINEYLKQNPGARTFGKILKLGFMISLVGGFIYATYVFIFYEFINPSYKESLIEVALEKMEERSMDVPEEQMESGIAFMKQFFSYMGFVGAVINVMFVGLVTSIIVGLWKKEN